MLTSFNQSFAIFPPLLLAQVKSKDDINFGSRILSHGSPLLWLLISAASVTVCLSCSLWVIVERVKSGTEAEWNHRHVLYCSTVEGDQLLGARGTLHLRQLYKIGNM